ncbi:SsgA family sporulation/cell division regulator [Streptomyces sp. P01-B04]|uniref:SsgA family sporulation/cell division regulator n=1 Tax=Streptomyces poriferorum TaxID=2798799 RepID=A0ABY9IWV2_9ACTN|nr:MULTISPECIES: SsgA family sporulation/cell division regulator [Streptomyces]MBW5252773.1 SsgA family sporulation/cell division regulator [Streptomyces poriferorum]MBW5261971.1 SsgA family sporulation/cell division regulator [Streptomyces poriferorum]MDP5312500.1 SsgA family sporulation/cell division regulator [Streptomyces sp. Alt4]WLQ58468.1 SsgA family sporulation/cell division regulator [Streptomyces sp. Alt2]WSI63668.1 SsgA family sporulation/cell division regulator [Streptomyces sp. NB
MSPVIKEHARARLVTDARDLPVVPVELRYDTATATPDTIQVAFPGGEQWAVPRDLLERGLRAPVEQDGLRIWPCGRVQLVVERHTADGVEVVQFDCAPLIRFLRRTHSRTMTGAKPEAAPA